MALGIASMASGAIGAVGQYQSASAQASAQNAAATSNYEYQLKVRERNWDRERYRYNRGLTQYRKTTNQNELAAQRAYSGEQIKLNNIYSQASFKQQANLVNLVKNTGNYAAKGMTGKTATRLDNEIVSQFGRNQAIAAESLVGAQEAYGRQTDSITRQLESDNNRAYEKVAVEPLEGIAPPPPVMTPGPSGLGLLAGIGNAAIGGFQTYNDLKPPTP